MPEPRWTGWHADRPPGNNLPGLADWKRVCGGDTYDEALARLVRLAPVTGWHAVMRNGAHPGTPKKVTT